MNITEKETFLKALKNKSKRFSYLPRPFLDPLVSFVYQLLERDPSVFQNFLQRPSHRPLYVTQPRLDRTYNNDAMFQGSLGCCNVFQHVAVYSRMLKCCSILQDIRACCSVVAFI